MGWINEYGIELSVDETGRVHKGKGEGGGQFVNKNKEGSQSTRNRSRETIEETLAKSRNLQKKIKESHEPLREDDLIKLPSKAGNKTIEMLKVKLVSSDLPSEKQKQYMQGIERAVGNMPDGAHQRIQDNLKKVNFYGSIEEVGIGLHGLIESSMPLWIRLLGKLFSSKKITEAERRIAALTAPAAAWFGHDQSLHLDGATEKAQIGMGKLAKGLTTSHVYAHEFGHVIDGPNDELSKTPEWQQIWNDEIKKDNEPLTRYATTNPQEGFAEMCRLLYGGGGIDTEEVEKTFPKAVTFFKSRKLWE